MKGQNKKKEKEQKKEKPDEENQKELIATLQRVQADFENYRKRIEKEKAEFAKTACAGIIKELLPVLDNFEAALNHTSDSNEFVNGIKMIRSQLLSVFENAGLRPIEAEGKKFNPYVHEALMQEESDKDDGMIIEEFQKGYMLGDSVLRHSKVKVSIKKQQKSAEKTEEAKKEVE